MFNLTKLALLWDWVQLLKKDSADVHGDITSLDSRVDALEITAPKDYSTTETATGQKWIDGKEIYCRVLNGKFPEITSTQNITLEGFIASNICDLTCVLKTVDSIYFNRFVVFYKLDNNTFVVSSVSTFFSECDYNITIYYTKPDPAPGRAPEDPEPEEVTPEVKKTTKKKTCK